MRRTMAVIPLLLGLIAWPSHGGFVVSLKEINENKI
jgi:hypothetical protein